MNGYLLAPVGNSEGMSHIYARTSLLAIITMWLWNIPGYFSLALSTFAAYGSTWRNLTQAIANCEEKSMIILSMLNIDFSSPQGTRACLNSMQRWGKPVTICYLGSEAALLMPSFSVSFQTCTHSLPHPCPNHQQCLMKMCAINTCSRSSKQSMGLDNEWMPYTSSSFFLWCSSQIQPLPPPPITNHWSQFIEILSDLV